MTKNSFVAEVTFKLANSYWEIEGHKTNTTLSKYPRIPYLLLFYNESKMTKKNPLKGNNAVESI